MGRVLSTENVGPNYPPMGKQHRRANKRSTALEREAQRRLSSWGRELIREDIREAGDRAWIDWARDTIRRENMGKKFPEPSDEDLAADRRERSSWPVNDYVLGAALMLVGAIILIAIALATGLVKP